MKKEYIKAIQFFKENQNVSITQTAKMFNIDRGNLGIVLKKLNISEDRKQKYFCNFSYFRDIDNEDKAYWIGFILADGCIKKNGIFSMALNIEDKYILKEFNNALDSIYPINTEIRNTNFKQNAPISVLKIQNKEFTKYLTQYGIINNKTKNAVFNYENRIPDKFIHAYIRGIFDGDGWFTDSRHTKGKSKELGFSGTYDVCLGIQKSMMNFLNVYTQIIPYKNIYRLRYTNTDSILKIFNFMYKDASHYLIRKYEKLKHFADSNETIK